MTHSLLPTRLPATIVETDTSRALDEDVAMNVSPAGS